MCGTYEVLVLRCGRLICSSTPHHDKNKAYKFGLGFTDECFGNIVDFIPANNLKAELGKLEELCGQNCRTNYVVTPTRVGVELGYVNKLSSRDMAKNKFHRSKSFLLNPLIMLNI